MEKKNKQHLIVTIVFALMVASTIYYLYNTFKFHTYSEVVYYDSLLTLDNKDVAIENFEVYKDRTGAKIGGGTISIKNKDLVADNTVLKITIKFNKTGSLQTGKKNDITYEINYLSTQDSYQLDYQDIKFKESLNDFDTASITINSKDDKEVYKSALVKQDLVKLLGSNKAYRMDNVYVSPYLMKLGYFVTNDNIQKKYPKLSLEYRYLKKVDGKDEYVVFKKLYADTKDYLKNPSNIVYYHDKEDGNLLDKKLSVVVILENDKDNYTFSIDLAPNSGGDSNE